MPAKPLRFLVFQHVPHETPDRLIGECRRRHIRLFTVRFWKNDPIPPLDGFRGLIVMGGPMGVYDEADYPWLAREDAAIRTWVRQDRPYLGICLGAQLLAKALNTPVRKNHIKEIGFGTVTLTPAGRKDPLFKGFPGEIPVFQWHGDTFDIPKGGRWLAKSENCRNQIFRCKKRAYGLQMHVEVTPRTIAAWFRAGKKEIAALPYAVGVPAQIAHARRVEKSFRELTQKLFENFLRRAGLAA